jgi:hypothetical protein
MSDENQNDSEEQNGTYDTASKLYVLGGIPFMIVFFVGMFLLVGTCDGAGISIRA